MCVCVCVCVLIPYFTVYYKYGGHSPLYTTIRSRDQEPFLSLVKQSSSVSSENQRSRVSFLSDQAVKAQKGGNQILIPVVGVSTAGIVVTTPCDSTTALAHGTYSIYLVLQLCFCHSLVRRVGVMCCRDTICITSIVFAYIQVCHFSVASLGTLHASNHTSIGNGWCFNCVTIQSVT